MNIQRRSSLKSASLTLILATTLVSGCASAPGPGSPSVSPDAALTDAGVLRTDESDANASGSHSLAACQPVPGYHGLLVACPTEDSLEAWARRLHVPEPDETDLVTPLEPADPVVIRDGLEVYTALLQSVLRLNRGSLDLWEHTPVYSEAEIAYFRAHPTVWETVVEVRATEAGGERAERLEGALDDFEDDPVATRHLVLRDGVFYFEDTATATLAVNRLQLRDLFDEDRLELHRAGESFVLERGALGHYYHTSDPLVGYRARLELYDRVGVEGQLPPLASYRVAWLRRQLGLENLEVGAETAAGRPGRARFLSGFTTAARLVRLSPGSSQLGVVGDPDQVAAVVLESGRHGRVIQGVLDTAFEMVREGLFFDEPDIEKGQQDGIMRMAFSEAFRRGMPEYKVNGVVYQIFDEEGHPRPPQVCIDYITDAVERYAGRWWPNADSDRRSVIPGRINIRRYMPYRQVRALVGLADEHPTVADRYSFDAADRVAYRDRDAFFDNLWEHREALREGDVIVIYGLRSDNQNHYHSFYIYETDPVFGMPVAVTDQAGEARLRSWHQVMRSAPLRSVHHRVRWNPDWIEAPQAVEASQTVLAQASAVVDRIDSVDTAEAEPVLVAWQ